MPLPRYEDFYRPVLEIVGESNNGLTHKELFASVIIRLSLSREDQEVMTRNGTRPRFESHSRFVVFKLRKAGLLFTAETGRIQSTDSGRRYLASNEGPIQESEVNRIIAESEESPELPNSIPEDQESITPEEQMVSSYKQQQEMLADEILDSMKGISPDAFERLVNRLLSQMGYGQIEREQGYSGDEGIDGILNQDLLGLEKVYVQAKRYGDMQVREPEIRLFHSSLTAKGAGKGVFITTSKFHDGAIDAARSLSLADKFIRLIDGPELAQLMIDHGVGVVTEITYEVKKLDANYFAEV